MPRVTININTPNEASDQDLLTLDLPPGLTVQDLKGFVEAETSFPPSAQHFFLNGRALTNNAQTLEEAGVNDGEMLAVLIRQRGNAAQGQSQRPQPGPGTQPASGSGGARMVQDPEGLRLHILSDPAAQQQLRNGNPELFSVLNSRERWNEAFAMLKHREQEAERERQHQIALLNEDPFNVEAQRKIEEMIRQDNVIENLQHAYEHNPAVFGRVHMLYINIEVNGHPVKAFVDSGAQATIMSPECAEKCGIKRLIDTRYSGIAKGVGTAKILGRVHHAEIKIGGAILPSAFTVMEGKDVDLLFGLDMLRRYKAKIDLEKDALCFEGIEVPFLPESEIPKSLEEAIANEPTVSGPNGTRIGTETGVITEDPNTTRATASSSRGESSRQSQPAGAAQAGHQKSFPQEHIEQLVNMGFPPQLAAQALEATGGNVEAAANLLLMGNE